MMARTYWGYVTGVSNLCITGALNINKFWNNMLTFLKTIDKIKEVPFELLVYLQ